MTGFEKTKEVLEAGETVSFETEYTVTQEDLDNGSVLNTVTVTALTPSEDEIGDEDSIPVGADITPIIANDDDFGTYTLRYGGRLGNSLDNDLLDGVGPVSCKHMTLPTTTFR